MYSKTESTFPVHGLAVCGLAASMAIQHVAQARYADEALTNNRNCSCSVFGLSKQNPQAKSVYNFKGNVIGRRVHCSACIYVPHSICNLYKCDFY